MGRQAVKVAADTNILARAMMADDARQTRLAQDALARADRVAVTLPALCELVWVLRQGYKVEAHSVADGIRRLMAASNVEADRPAVAAGLALLDDGGDFADGVIAFEGRRLGGDTFLSFDRQAVRLIKAAGGLARTP